MNLNLDPVLITDVAALHRTYAVIGNGRFASPPGNVLGDRSKVVDTYGKAWSEAA